VREGDVRVHANGAQGVAAITVAVADLDASLARYRALLGPLAAQGVRATAMPGLGLHQATLPLGATALVLAAPGADTHDSAGLRALLGSRGEGVLGLALRGTGDAPPIALSRERAHGAAFEIVPG